MAQYFRQRLGRIPKQFPPHVGVIASGECDALVFIGDRSPYMCACQLCEPQC